MSRTLPSLAALLLLARCLVLALAADAPPEDRPRPLGKLTGPARTWGRRSLRGLASDALLS